MVEEDFNLIEATKRNRSMISMILQSVAHIYLSFLHISRKKLPESSPENSGYFGLITFFFLEERRSYITIALYNLLRFTQNKRKILAVCSTSIFDLLAREIDQCMYVHNKAYHYANDTIHSHTTDEKDSSVGDVCYRVV